MIMQKQTHGSNNVVFTQGWKFKYLRLFKVGLSIIIEIFELSEKTANKIWMLKYLELSFSDYESTVYFCFIISISQTQIELSLHSRMAANRPIHNFSSLQFICPWKCTKFLLENFFLSFQGSVLLVDWKFLYQK